MGYKILQLKDDSEFEELCRIGRESYETPLSPLWELYFPMFGNDEAAREATTKEAAERLVHWYHGDPTAIWLKVVDETSGKLLGATLWNIFEENPYATEDDHECTWFPAGEARDIATGLVAQFTTPRTKYMPKPHVFLHIAFTAPAARKQGVMSLLLEWGVKEADKRGFECYLDATPMGKPVYRRFGFIPAGEHRLTMEPFPSTETAREMEKQVLPVSWWPMFRPAYGEFEEGKTTLPWETSG